VDEKGDLSAALFDLLGIACQPARLKKPRQKTGTRF
jgi:hypothetical protein